MSERLPLPIKSVLAERDHAASLERVRGRLDDATVRRRSPGRAIVALAFAAAILLALGFAIGRAGRPTAAGPAPSAPTSAPPATTAVPAAIAFVEMTTEDGTSSQSLGDGTKVELAPKSGLRVRAAQPDLVALSLDRGEAHFVVAKRPERAFRVEAGKVTITVRGTAFRVVRKGEGASVSVEEGRVEVASAEGTLTLEAGDTFPRAKEGAGDDAAMPAPPKRGEGAPAWRPFAAKGDYPAAYAALGAGGVDRETAVVTDAATLFALADVARLSGHPREAVPPLRRLVAEHRADSRASLAAFTLAKLELESLGDPRGAALHFDESIRLGAPASVVEDASARRVEAYARAGDAAKARAAAAEYRAKFPGGRYEAEVTSWASGAR